MWCLFKKNKSRLFQGVEFLSIVLIQNVSKSLFSLFNLSSCLGLGPFTGEGSR